MLAVVRLLLLALFILLVGVLGSLFCLLRPFHPNHVCRFAHLFARMAPVLGIRLRIEGQENLPQGPAVYVCNHQNNYDLFTAAGGVRPGTVSIGKKSLKWIPFFGQLYWLTGNILIDRKNSARAKGTLDVVGRRIREDGLSVWLFPEGTRSYGRGLLPFKTGAFHTAVDAQVPIVPVVVSSLDRIRLNQWHNGEVVVRYLPAIDTSQVERRQVRELSQQCHAQMSQALAELG
ncbi:1-acylglycerol-3-phosphate O-acyltransferase [Gallaecimonas sp. GXIMD4217]|uniref:1-acylglycerol-3-phosphate O-acyltransferase n=1 Tax=Gallaecimonas sp. GXIMD4217 TaxID=3131927 RepID=UPI00311AD546